MKWTVVGITAAMALLLFCGEARALDRDTVMRMGVDPEKVEQAVKRAVEYLKAQQGADGSWQGQRLSGGYPEGVTALVTYALLKAGVKPSEECIGKAFEHLRKQPFKTVYSVSCLILALSALCQPPPLKDEEKKMLKNPMKRTTVFDPPDERMRKRRKKMPKGLRDLLQRAVRWLIQQQTKEGVWRYPGNQPGGNNVAGSGPYEDASNSQYAMLALYSAKRVGVPVPSSIFAGVANWFLKNQEADGPEVKPFKVPAADLSINKLKKMEKDILRRMEDAWKEQVKGWRNAKRKGEEPPKLESPRKTTVVDIPNPYKRMKGELGKMKARGWSYVNREGKLVPAQAPNMKQDWTKVTGSMTTSGIISLVICKEALEGKSGSLTKAISRGIRDGMAWLAHNWTVTKNPNAQCWHLYYLYGIERAAVLALAETIGEHKWYKEGADYLIGAQQSDGSWQGESENVQWARGELGLGPVENTCFAILFLLRATMPIIKDETIYSGKGILGDRPKDK